MNTLHSTLEAVQVRTAVRFPLHLDVLLKTPKREYEAITVDVSANGVLFEADELPAVGEDVTFELKMPAAVMGGTVDVLVHCVGRVVRHVQTPKKKMAAAVIDEYSLRAE